MLTNSKRAVDGERNYHKLDTDPVSDIYNEIRKLRDERGASQLYLKDIRDRLRMSGGFDEQKLADTIEKYEDLIVWMRIGQSLVLI